MAMNVRITIFWGEVLVLLGYMLLPSSGWSIHWR